MKRLFLSFFLLISLIDAKTALCQVSNSPSFGEGWGDAFARGADISWCTEMESDGKTFCDANGVQTDIFVLMKNIGMTAVRLRVWVNPSRFGYGAWCDKVDVLAKARRAHAQGLDVMIDFHYSDFFADPGRQTTPLDWAGYNMEQMKTVLVTHTKDVLQTLKDEGIVPKWVQVGNETNSGMVWDTGKIDWNKSGNARYTQYVTLSNAGYDAVKEVLPQAYVIVHLGNTESALWFYKEFKAAGGKFDMIGLSHYPTETEWNSTSSNVAKSNVNAAKIVQEAARQFGVPVMICETGFNVNQPDLASQVMKDLFARMREIPQCAGIFYWEPQTDGRWKPAYYNKVGWVPYGLGAFTTDGRPTAALDAFTEDAILGIDSTPSASPYEEGSQKGNVLHSMLNVQYYDLLGRQLDATSKGLHVVKRGKKTCKIYRK